MTYSPSQFRQTFPTLVHYAPFGVIDLSKGLLTAAQLLDANVDNDGHVWAKFPLQAIFQRWHADHWKSTSRFVRKAGETGCNLVLRDKDDATKTYVLGNNFPLGDGSCLGCKIPLTDNRPGDPAPTAADWFRTLNSMFWVFDARRVNDGVLNHLRAASPSGRLARVRIDTAKLEDTFIEEHVRLSAINGGASNGCRPRGTATYKRPSEWIGPKPPKEIGIRDGLSGALVAALGLQIDEG